MAPVPEDDDFSLGAAALQEEAREDTAEARFETLLPSIEALKRKVSAICGTFLLTGDLTEAYSGAMEARTSFVTPNRDPNPYSNPR